MTGYRLIVQFDMTDTAVGDGIDTTDLTTAADVLRSVADRLADGHPSGPVTAANGMMIGEFVTAPIRTVTATGIRGELTAAR